MLTIHDVFHWFLEKEAMSFKKANFLCYYAQAWYVTLYDKGPFFKEGFQAWVHGPVSPDLFHEYKGNGYRLPILKEDTRPFSETWTKKSAAQVILRGGLLIRFLYPRDRTIRQ